MSILDVIVSQKKTDVALRKQKAPLSSFESSLLKSDRSFLEALKKPGLSLIAEMKRKSPSSGELRPDFSPAEIASAYDGRASAISVLCDEPFFGGSLAHLEIARKSCKIPLLAKDFVVDPHQIFEARKFGADAILLIASVLDAKEIEDFLAHARSLEMECLVEVHTEEELDLVLGSTSAAIVGVNSRDLKTMKIDEDLPRRWSEKIRRSGRLMVAESGMDRREHVDRAREFADAVLLGTAFMRAPDLGAKLTELGF